MNQPDAHFDEVTALLYIERQLDAARAGEVSAHLAACRACSELLHALEAESVWLREALTADNEPIPARMIAAPERGGAHWGWIAAFGLGVGGAYTLWSGVIEPWYAGASQAGFDQGNILTMLFFSGAFWKGWDAMRSLTEFLAVATLGTVAIWLLRKTLHRFTAIAFVAGALACALALPPPAAAAQVEHGDPGYTLPAGQDVKNDLIVFADRAQINGDVDGDLILFSRNATVKGHVKGDIIAFSTDLHVEGAVDGNVRCAIQTLTLSTVVAKNVTGWVGELDLEPNARIGGTLMAGDSDLVLEGSVGGDLMVLANAAEIDGTLGRDATIRANRLTIGPSAQIAGQTKYIGYRAPDVSPSAKLGNPIQITVPKRGPDYSRLAYYWHQVMFCGASFLLGLVILLVAPGFFFDVSQACKRAGPAIGFGALFLFATPIAAFIVCLTIVGASVGIPVFLFWLIALYAAKIFVGAWLGELILGAGVGVGPVLGRLALGLVILRALGMIPFLGPLVGLVVVMWGIGAVVLALHRRMSPPVAHAPALAAA